MSRVLVAGLCPLPFENCRSTFGPGIRTWQFARSLASKGHEVTVVAMRVQSAYGNTIAPDREEVDGVHIERWPQSRYSHPEALRRRVTALAPDAVVGASVYGSHALASIAPDQPFWADQFGCVMAEAQAKAYLERENWPVDHFWELLRPILERADRFSAVSERQRYALIGELGIAGRLTYETCGYEFTAVSPCAAVPPAPWPTRPMLRGSKLPADAFIVLWSGGYNVWSDVDTLFQALELAMAQCHDLHFVSTGGSIGGHDEQTYERFRRSATGSPFADRFHLQGWVLAEDVPSYVAEADLGVVTEIPIYEGLLGSKNRVVQWMAQGLPVAYNRVGDLGDLLAEQALGLTFRSGDAAALGRELLTAAANRSQLARMAEAARCYAAEHFTFEATTRDLVAWADEPVSAPGMRSRRAGLSPQSERPSTTGLPQSSNRSLWRRLLALVERLARADRTA